MAKKQTRRSISVSRATYERLKAYCETHGISMSQFVETRVGDFLGRTDPTPRPVVSMPRPVAIVHKEEAEDKTPEDLTADQIFTF